jgi:hypothetical protein
MAEAAFREKLKRIAKQPETDYKIPTPLKFLPAAPIVDALAARFCSLPRVGYATREPEGQGMSGELG